MTKEEQLLEQKAKIEQELKDIKKKKDAEKRAEEKLARKVFGVSKEEAVLLVDMGRTARQLIERYLRAKGDPDLSLERFEGYVLNLERRAAQNGQ